MMYPSLHSNIVRYSYYGDTVTTYFGRQQAGGRPEFGMQFQKIIMLKMHMRGKTLRYPHKQSESVF